MQAYETLAKRDIRIKMSETKIQFPLDHSYMHSVTNTADQVK